MVATSACRVDQERPGSLRLPRAFVSLPRYPVGQHLVALLEYQDVVLDPNATEAAEHVDVVPDHAVAVLVANLRSLEHVRGKVDPRLNGDDMPGLQRQVDA